MRGDKEFKRLKQIISLALFAAFGISAVFNILFLFGRIGSGLLQTGLIIVLAAAFFVSLIGFVIKSARREEIYIINIITPVKELGILYTGIIIVWTATYFLALLNR